MKDLAENKQINLNLLNNNKALLWITVRVFLFKLNMIIKRAYSPNENLQSILYDCDNLKTSIFKIRSQKGAGGSVGRIHYLYGMYFKKGFGRAYYIH